MGKSREEVRSAVRSFISRINAGNPEGLMEHQTEDFVFIDYDGDITRGRDGWHGYFRDYSDYKIHVKHIIISGNGAAIIGETTGCHVGPEVEKEWTILWTAEVRDDLLSEWRIYSDVHEVRERLKKVQRPRKQREHSEAVKSTTLSYIYSMNAGDSKGLMELQSEDFTLIDYEGGVYRGRSGWEDYFKECPNYKIHVDHVITSGNGVAILGRTTGSHVSPEVEERETILWTAQTRDGLVAEWRLYSDTEEVEREIQQV
ncbi:MAG: nuclear transport factor 2 family protein [Candidatus Thorarchaeota archaeon]|nr:MAG: nuclear transport factor 2 family protein [Candidatus Thorarchaeota archaeon]